MYHFALALALIFSPFMTSSPVMAAEDTLSGTVSLQTTSIAAGIGVQWGDGVLTYNGEQHVFSVEGLEVLGIGYSEVQASGNVYNLTKLSDFEGVYASAEASATAGSGPATITMKNPNGVTIALHAIQEGVELTLAAGGVNIDLQNK